MKINIAHSEFPEQKRGLMICGYEWGYSREDEEADTNGIVNQPADPGVLYTFANKQLGHGDRALRWRYDQRIIKWFEIWGTPFNRSNPGEFEQSVIQTNWCNGMNNSIEDYSMINDKAQVDNFLCHIDYFMPSLILFMGSRMIDALQNPETLEKFQSIMGGCTKLPVRMQKEFPGRRFNLTFQSFEKCEVVCLPHPSGSHGLEDEYIKLFAGEMGAILKCFRSKHSPLKSM